MRQLLILSFTSLLLLAGCQTPENLPIEPFNDRIIGSTYTPKWGCCQGILSIYEVYGTNPSGLKEGTAVSIDHKFAFRIKDLLKKNSKYISTETLFAVNRQEKLLAGASK